MGQTKRKLKIRLHEHILDINKKIEFPSVITEHRVSHNHNFNWKEIKILNNEPS